MTASRDPSIDSTHKVVVDEQRIEDFIEKEPVAGPSTGDKQAKDAALEILGSGTEHHEITEEEDRRVLRKIDLWVMPVVLLVYFLQQLDKSSLSYTSVFGIVEATGLVGTQYSWLSSIVYLAQLIWQPISSFLLVKLPIAKYLFVNVCMWGVVVAATSAAHDFRGLITARFFLGIFEASVAPAFITITQMWWRRREQTMRLSMWMAMNGGTGMVGSLLSWGLGHIHGRLQSYQVIFLFIGLLTVVCSPIVLLVLPDSPSTAKFLSREEKIVALERLRANNQGTETKVWKWEQVWDLLLDLKTYLWFCLLFLCAVPSGGIGAFGPLIIAGFGFDQFYTILFNVPFAFIQIIITLSAAWISTKLKLKWPVIFGLSIPPIAGVVALLKLGRDKEDRGALLACYYVLSFFNGLQPMLYTWSAQNTAGHTKKLCTTGMVFVAQCAGNIVGPLLYRTDEKPYYRRGLIANLICWIALAVLTLITAVFLAFRNKQQATARRRLGKAGKVVDRSLETYSERRAESDEYTKPGQGELKNDKAFDDLTDTQNEDFIYVL
ncbi:MFS general substrate transporter [Dendrothele bispora CBS 962.96]|uniref:MFS general substrate transporter n=1 Tax=Dendrothele bispora (strain CBS 962.96) TaxID=1314807 RepID=A0A4S8MB03_DENBC|nr:MFS general substrate transporter [Dendrothele bispora CBS 962.96]